MHACHNYQAKGCFNIWPVWQSLLCQKVLSSYEPKTHPYQAKHCQVTSGNVLFKTKQNKTVKMKDSRRSHCHICHCGCLMFNLLLCMQKKKHHTTPPLVNVIYMCSIKSVLLVVEMMKSTSTVAILYWDKLGLWVSLSKIKMLIINQLLLS